MPIIFVGSHVGTHAAITAQAVAFSNLRDAANVQPTLQQGDIVLVAVENASTVNRTTAGGADVLVPSGYTGIGTHDYRDDSNDSNFRVSYKVMGATPDTSVSIPASNATTAGVAYAIYVFRGVNTIGGPLNGAAVTTGNINTAVADAAAITPTVAGSWVVVFAGAAAAAGTAFTRPANTDATTNYFRSATLTTTTNDPVIGGAIYSGWTSGAFDPNAFGGSTTTNTGSWSAVTLALLPLVTHDTSATLTGQGATASGSADHVSAFVSHATSGTLTGQGGAVTGSAARLRAFATSGVLAGQGSAVAGSAAHQALHTTGGILSGQGGSLSGSAARTRQHDASGAVTGPGGIVDASAARVRIFGSSGVLAGSGSTASASAARSGLAVVHDASGVLEGQGSDLSGRASSRDMPQNHMRGKSLSRRGRQVKFADELPEPAALDQAPAPLPSLEVARAAIADARRAVEAVRIARRQAKERADRQEAINALSVEYQRALGALSAARDSETRIMRRMQDDEDAFFLAA